VTAAREFSPPSNPVARWLRTAAGVVLTGLMVFAPLNFGSTRAGGPEALALGCLLALFFWVASWLCGGPRPQVPLFAAGGVALLVVAALPWISGLASPTPVADFTQAHFAAVAARWPSSIVWHTPANSLVCALALAAVVLPLIDLARTQAWAVTFSVALTATAVAVGLLALLQNYTHAPGIYWRHDRGMTGNFCGPFYHHTAAGAYFNTAWPLAVALTWLARIRRLPWVVVAAAGVGTLIVLAAHGSHVSRFPQVAALAVAPFLLRSFKAGSSRRWLWLAGAAAAVGLLVAVAGRPGEIVRRWQLLLADAPAVTVQPIPPESRWPALMRADLFVASHLPGGRWGDRGESWSTAGRSVAERPLTGHGPGNWMGAASQNTEDPFVRTFFQFLQFTHQDLLQFAVEWGVPATLGWWGLLVGALVAVIRVRRWLSPLHRQLGIAAACGLAAVLLQSQVDFPLQMPAVALNVVVLTALCWAGATPIPSSASIPVLP